MIVALSDELTKPRKVSTIEIRHMPFGRFEFILDGKPLRDVQMARLCVGIIEAIRDQA